MAIDFSISELVALSVESFFFGTLPLSTPPPRVRAKTQKNVAGIYFVLFGSSVRTLLKKRKTISGTTPLLALAGVFGILITWVSHTTFLGRRALTGVLPPS